MRDPSQLPQGLRKRRPFIRIAVPTLGEETYEPYWCPLQLSLGDARPFSEGHGLDDLLWKLVLGVSPRDTAREQFPEDDAERKDCMLRDDMCGRRGVCVRVCERCVGLFCAVILYDEASCTAILFFNPRYTRSPRRGAPLTYHHWACHTSSNAAYQTTP